MIKWPRTYVSIHGCSKPRCNPKPPPPILGLNPPRLTEQKGQEKFNPQKLWLSSIKSRIQFRNGAKDLRPVVVVVVVVVRSENWLDWSCLNHLEPSFEAECPRFWLVGWFKSFSPAFVSSSISPSNSLYFLVAVSFSLCLCLCRLNLYVALWARIKKNTE